MKLWHCYANGIDWEAHTLLAGETLKQVHTRWVEIVEDAYGWCAGEDVYEATEIDGYTIISVTDKEIMLRK